MKIVPIMENGGNGSVTTAAAGANYTALAAQACHHVTIVNDTGTKLEVQQNTAGTALRIPDGQFYTFYGIKDASQLGVRRADTSNSQVTATYRWES